jgi:hypothetical protein
MSKDDTEARIDGFLGCYTPQIETQLRQARQRMRALFPRGFELVFDNYNALVFGYSPSERSADSRISIAGYPKWVTLFFLHGAALDDPQGLLEGKGKQVRSIRLEQPQDLDAPAVLALIRQAAAPQQEAFLAAPRLSTAIRMAMAKPRPRRPAAPASRRKS